MLQWFHLPTSNLLTTLAGEFYTSVLELSHFLQQCISPFVILENACFCFPFLSRRAESWQIMHVVVVPFKKAWYPCEGTWGKTERGGRSRWGGNCHATCVYSLIRNSLELCTLLRYRRAMSASCKQGSHGSFHVWTVNLNTPGKTWTPWCDFTAS